MTAHDDHTPPGDTWFSTSDVTTNPDGADAHRTYGCRMTTAPLPTHDLLGPDPEPLGDRADRLITSCRRDDREARTTLLVAGSVRGRIVVARLGKPVSRHANASSS